MKKMMIMVKRVIAVVTNLKVLINFDLPECNQLEKDYGRKLDEEAQPTENSLFNSASSGMAVEALRDTILIH